MYQLHIDGQSLFLANRLLRERDEYFSELYHFTYGICHYDNIEFLPTLTETTALSIIHQKELYDKRIERLQERYARFQRLIEDLFESDRKLIVDYFEWNQKIDYEQLLNCIIHNLEYFERFYEKVVKEKHRLALKSLGEYLRQK